MKKRLLPFILAGALTAAFAAPAAAQTNNCDIDIPQGGGGAAALAALIAAAVDADVVAGTICNVDVDLLNNSLNNLLRNADIDVLNNALNNILRNADIIDDVTVTVSGNVISVDLLSGPDFILTLVQ